jgi:hypothetical protein
MDGIHVQEHIVCFHTRALDRMALQPKFKSETGRDFDISENVNET